MPYFNIKTQAWSDIKPEPRKDILTLAKEISEALDCTVMSDGLENIFVDKNLTSAETTMITTIMSDVK